MSQTSKVVKELAAGNEYKALVEAIGTADGESICQSYLQISQLLEEKKKEILARIQSLSRQNKDEDSQKFQTAFALRTSTSLPEWHRLNSLLKEQKIMEGEVFRFGAKGDPLVKAEEDGRVVLIKGATLEKGAKIRFKLVAQGEKLDFGRVFELTPDYFYFLLNQQTLAKLRDLFDSVEERIKHLSLDSDEFGLAELSEILRQLEEARGQIVKLKESERERVAARVQANRKRLLTGCGVRLAFQFLAQEEAREIAESCQGDKQKIARALSAPGLFCYRKHEALKAELIVEGEPRGYSEMLRNLENKLDSMNAALEFIEFKSSIEKVYPSAKRYLERMDSLFERLDRLARRVAFNMAESRIYTVEDIHSTFKDAFSGASLGSEFRRTFRSAEEFYTLRGALLKLRTMLGNQTSQADESALKPYLMRKIPFAFGDRGGR